VRWNLQFLNDVIFSSALKDLRERHTLRYFILSKQGDGILNKKRSSFKNYACDLLSPTIAFYKSLGMDLQQIQQIVSRAYDEVGNFKNYKKIDHSADSLDVISGDAVSKWTRNPLFLDSQGQPKVLPLKGKTSFFSLARAVDKNCDPMNVLNILIRYGTVKKINGGNSYKLKAQYCKTNSDNRISINSATSFLWDVNKSIIHLLKRRVSEGKKDPFWFRAHIDCLSKKDIEKFMTFMRERTMLFILEADDWLEAHRTKRRTGNQKAVQRVGLGIFTFANSYLDAKKVNIPR
jgi:hypothetical protein